MSTTQGKVPWLRCTTKKMILCVFETIWVLLHINFVETIPGHMDPHKRLNCCIIHARPVVGDLALFSQMHAFIIYIETWILKPIFKNVHFQAPKTLLSCKWMAKTQFSVFLGMHNILVSYQILTDIRDDWDFIFKRVYQFLHLDYLCHHPMLN